MDAKLKEVCAGISRRYEVESSEIGTDEDHVHFLVQSVPAYSPKKIVQTIKGITAGEIFRACPEVRKYLRGAEFRTDGYFMSTAGRHGTERMIRQYIREQGAKGVTQLALF